MNLPNFSTSPLVQKIKKTVGNLLITLLFFILILFPMILFHEFGHYIVGKMLGLNPHTFSIGFGPSFYSFEAFNTTWKLSSIPLGGYVEFPESARSQGGAWLVTCLMGPLFNFIYAFACFFFVALKQQQDLIAFKGKLFENTGTFIYFRPSSFFTGPTRVVFKPDGSQWTRLVGHTNFVLEQSASLTKTWGDWAKLVFQLMSKKKPLHLRALLKLSLKNPNIPHFSQSGFIGPLGIMTYGRWAYQNSKALFFIACGSMSLSLGLFNLLPLMFLDGGQALMALLNIKLGANQTFTDGEALYVIISAILLLVFLILTIGGDLWNILKKITFNKRGSNDQVK